MSPLSGLLIVLGVGLAIVETAPWSLGAIALWILAAWLWRRPQDAGQRSGKMRRVEGKDQEGDAP